MKHRGREQGVGGDSGSSSVAEEKGRKRSGGNKTDERGREGEEEQQLTSQK